GCSSTSVLQACSPLEFHRANRTGSKLPVAQDTAESNHTTALTRATTARPTHRLPGRRGVVLIILLFAIVLLAAMVFFVINLGWHTKAKTVTQNTADASALAGASWVARSFNTVAMNNVAQSRYLATVNMLDAMPLTVKAANSEQQFM